jgi:hypothetical protein
MKKKQKKKKGLSLEDLLQGEFCLVHVAVFEIKMLGSL